MTDADNADTHVAHIEEAEARRQEIEVLEKRAEVRRLTIGLLLSGAVMLALMIMSLAMLRLVAQTQDQINQAGCRSAAAATADDAILAAFDYVLAPPAEKDPATLAELRPQVEAAREDRAATAERCGGPTLPSPATTVAP